MAGTTLSKKMCSHFNWNFSFGEMCLSALKRTPYGYATNAFSSKKKYEKLDAVIYVLQTTQNLVISRCCFAEDGK